MSQRMEHYHWRGYSMEAASNHPFAQVFVHRGHFPMHRHCKGMNIECTPFSFVEAYLWVRSEKWNDICFVTPSGTSPLARLSAVSSAVGCDRMEHDTISHAES